MTFGNEYPIAAKYDTDGNSLWMRRFELFSGSFTVGKFVSISNIFVITELNTETAAALLDAFDGSVVNSWKFYKDTSY